MIKMIKMIIVIGTELANVAHSVQNLGLAGNRKRSPGTLIIIMIIFPAKKIDFDLDGGFNLFFSLQVSTGSSKDCVPFDSNYILMHQCKLAA